MRAAREPGASPAMARARGPARDGAPLRGPHAEPDRAGGDRGHPPVGPGPREPGDALVRGGVPECLAVRGSGHPLAERVGNRTVGNLERHWSSPPVLPNSSGAPPVHPVPSGRFAASTTAPPSRSAPAIPAGPSRSPSTSAASSAPVSGSSSAIRAAVPAATVRRPRKYRVYAIAVGPVPSATTRAIGQASTRNPSPTVAPARGTSRSPPTRKPNPAPPRPASPRTR